MADGLKWKDERREQEVGRVDLEMAAGDEKTSSQIQHPTSEIRNSKSRSEAYDSHSWW